MSDSYRERLLKAKEIAQSNLEQPGVLARDADGNHKHPFRAAYYKAALPDLLARGDALLADLGSSDYAVRVRAERGIDRIQKEIENLGKPGM